MNKVVVDLGCVDDITKFLLEYHLIDLHSSFKMNEIYLFEKLLRFSFLGDAHVLIDFGHVEIISTKLNLLLISDQDFTVDLIQKYTFGAVNSEKLKYRLDFTDDSYVEFFCTSAVATIINNEL